MDALDRLLEQVKLENSFEGRLACFKREMSKCDESGCTTAFSDILKNDWVMPVVAQSGSISRKSSTESLDSQPRPAKKSEKQNDFPVYELHFGVQPRVFSPPKNIVNVAQLAIAATPHTTEGLPEQTPLKVLCDKENSALQYESPIKTEKNGGCGR